MHISTQTIAQALPWPRLIQTLHSAMTDDQIQTPSRHHHTLNKPGAADATLLLMPAWKTDAYLGIKHVNIFAQNYQQGLPALTSTYHLYCGKTGQNLATLDGNEITVRRTAAASALASQYLSREDTRSMLLIGAGKVGRQLIRAHTSVRPIDTVWIWDRSPTAANALAQACQQNGISAHVCSEFQLPQIAGSVDLVSCATLATEPVIRGDWIQSGTHIDLVGSFTPQMREADNGLIQKAEVYVDFRAQALVETGDLIQPIQAGYLHPQDIRADLPQLCKRPLTAESVRDIRNGFKAPNNAITLFKSVGDAREDLATAILVYESIQHGSADQSLNLKP